MTQVSTPLAPLVDMKLVFHEAGALRANTFQLMPAESLKLRVVGTGTKHGRMVPARSNLEGGYEVCLDDLRSLMYHRLPDKESASASSHNSSGSLNSWEGDLDEFVKDNMYGPLLLATITIEQYEKSSSNQSIAPGTNADVVVASESGSVSSARRPEDGGDSQWANADSTTIDVVGYVFAGPTTFVFPVLASSLSSGADADCIWQLVSESSVPVTDAATLPCEELATESCFEIAPLNSLESAISDSKSDIQFQLKHKYLWFQAANTNPGGRQDVECRGLAARFAGLQLQLPCGSASGVVFDEPDEALTDSFVASVKPMLSSLAPKQSAILRIELVSGANCSECDVDARSPAKDNKANIAGSKAACNFESMVSLPSSGCETSKYKISTIRLLVMDNSYPLHRKGFVSVDLISPVQLSPIAAKPVSTTNRIKSHLGPMMPSGSHPHQELPPQSQVLHHQHPHHSSMSRTGSNDSFGSVESIASADVAKMSNMSNANPSIGSGAGIHKTFNSGSNLYNIGHPTMASSRDRDSFSSLHSLDTVPTAVTEQSLSAPGAVTVHVVDLPYMRIRGVARRSTVPASAEGEPQYEINLGQQVTLDTVILFRFCADDRRMVAV
jgi:hypothetical protein